MPNTYDSGRIGVTFADPSAEAEYARKCGARQYAARLWEDIAREDTAIELAHKLARAQAKGE
jgi:hypothetical protein